jgi:hypothetical protein
MKLIMIKKLVTSLLICGILSAASLPASAQSSLVNDAAENCNTLVAAQALANENAITVYQPQIMPSSQANKSGGAVDVINNMPTSIPGNLFSVIVDRLGAAMRDLAVRTAQAQVGSAMNQMTGSMMAAAGIKNPALASRLGSVVNSYSNVAMGQANGVIQSGAKTISGAVSQGSQPYTSQVNSQIQDLSQQASTQYQGLSQSAQTQYQKLTNSAPSQNSGSLLQGIASWFK